MFANEPTANRAPRAQLPRREVNQIDFAPRKLRTGGTVVCGLDREHAAPGEEAMLRALPDAQVWTETHPAGAVVVAQLPHVPVNDAALEMER
jgi:hypothetical protein